MFNMIFENKDGKQLHFGAGSPYTITEFDGLNPPKATINTNTTATLDGGMFNSSKLEMRSINVAFAIEEDAEANRLAIYKVIQSKMPLRIYYQSDLLDIFIDGYVDECEISYFAQKNIVTVSVLCPFPYFKGAQEIINELSAVIAKFHFPFFSAQSKNLIPYPYYRPDHYEINGITYDVSNDGIITMQTGTSTAEADYHMRIRTSEDTAFHLDEGTYILSGCDMNAPNGVSILINGMDKNGNNKSVTSQSTSYPNGRQFTIDDTYDLDRFGTLIYCAGNVTITSPLTFEPMIRLASIENATWQPSTYKEEFVFGEVDTLTSAAVDNDGAVETGLTFELYAKAPVSDPKIIDYYTSEFIEIDIDMLTGDLITVTTGQGNKTVTLLRDGERTNIFNLLSKNSTWLQLPIGGGVYVYEVGTGTVTNLDVTIKHYDLYEGV